MRHFTPIMDGIFTSRCLFYSITFFFLFFFFLTLVADPVCFTRHLQLTIIVNSSGPPELSTPNSFRLEVSPAPVSLPVKV